MTKMNLDTFWGSTLAFALNNYINFKPNNSLLHFSILTLLSLIGYHNLCNLVVSFSSNDSLSIIIYKALSSSISAFLLDFRFENSFKPGERILLSQLISKLVLSAHAERFQGWPSFFLLLNFFPFVVAPIVFRKQFNLISVGAWIVFSASFTLNKFLIFDLVNEITKNVAFGIYWALMLLITISTPLLFPLMFSSQNSLRKFYHFAAVVLFVPAAFHSLKVLQIALAVAASLFLLIETIRNEANSKNLKSSALLKLNEFMARCRNELDSGEMVLSHLYLLLGCAIPFWFNLNDLKMSSLSGVIALGIGDSLASIGGRAYGQMRWHPGTLKTIEGSLWGCIGMFISWFVYNQCRFSPFVPLNSLLIIAIGSSLWEALIDLNDNITLPIFTFLLINILTDG